MQHRALFIAYRSDRIFFMAASASDLTLSMSSVMNEPFLYRTLPSHIERTTTYPSAEKMRMMSMSYAGVM